MREVCRQPFQRPGPSYQKKKKLHFKNFKKKKNNFLKNLFSDHVWTWSFIRDVHRQPFQRSSPSYPKRKNFVSKFSKKKKFFQKNFLWTTFGLDPLWERYVGNLSKVRSQSLKKHFFKGSKSRHFFV